MPETPERKFSPQALLLVREHVGYLESSGIFNERVFPALRLYGYNFFTLHQNPTQDQILEFRNRCVQINEREEAAAASHNPLCTIGGELEAFYTPAARAIFERLKIPFIKEEDSSNRLWEVMFPWSYSADTQITMLQELVKMDAVKPIPGLGTGLKGQDRRRMALHMNYAMPEQMQDEFFMHPDVMRKLYDVNDAIILGFTSANRILEMPMTTLTYDREAERTPKTSQIVTDSNYIVFRVELRGLEFTESLTYALLRDTQRLMTAYFAWAMSHFVLPSEREKDLISIFTKFQSSFTAIRNAYHIPLNFAHGGMVEKQHATAIINQPENIPSQVRQLISRTSMEVDQVLAAA